MAAHVTAPTTRPLPRAPARRAVTASLAGLGTAVPAAFDQASLWTDFFAEHYGHGRLAEKIWQHCGVRTRHAVADPRITDLRFAGTGERMRRFMEHGLPLGIQAVEACLADAGLDRSDVGQLTVVSCTGYGTPGIDIRLADELGLSSSVQRLHIGHIGCYAAVPGLAATADAAAARGKVGLMLCLELTSLHVQPPSDEIEQVVAHALFSDAAVAAAVVPDSAGFEVLDVVARTDADHAALMTWDVTDLGFKMASPRRCPTCSNATSKPSSTNCSRPTACAAKTSVPGPCTRAGPPSSTSSKNGSSSPTTTSAPRATSWPSTATARRPRSSSSSIGSGASRSWPTATTSSSWPSARA
jgi:predicted naringenin-chalcone synthase